MKTVYQPLLFIALLFTTILFGSCDTNAPKNIRVASPDNNTLRVNVSFDCSTPGEAWVEYWEAKQPEKVMITPVSPTAHKHAITLTDLNFDRQYEAHAVVLSGESRVRSEKLSFNTAECPDDLLDMFRVSSDNEKAIPQSFKNGCVLVHKMVPPSLIALCNTEGELRWYHRFNNTGVKVAGFTPKKTIVALLGTPGYPMARGDEIVELSLAGDTLFHLKKGEKALQDTITHEILKDKEGNYVTITLQKKVVDLSSIGGGKEEVLGANGILVVDKEGNKVWDWSLFDEIAPLTEKDILSNRDNICHANSIGLDEEGNFILSLYKKSQVWKISRKTKKVLWKLGKDGDLSLPVNAYFEHSHAAHYSSPTQITLFNNGALNETSQLYCFSIDEENKKADVELILNLSSDAFTEFMGSGYRIDDNHLYTCASLRNSVFLFNKEGTPVWRMSFPFSSYRSVFIPYDDLDPYITN